MAWNAAAHSPTNGKPPQLMRGGRVFALLLLFAPLVSGCETLERMTYWDCFFKLASKPEPPAPIGPVKNSRTTSR